MKPATTTPNNLYPPSILKSICIARNLINEDVGTHMVLRKLAKNAGTNEFTLKKGFKDIFKITIYQYLLKSRMQYASRLLQTTDLKVKDIGKVCGFETLSGFITSFKKYHGITPGEIKRISIAKNKLYKI